MGVGGKTTQSDVHTPATGHTSITHSHPYIPKIQSKKPKYVING